jgi:hypothetical protein
MRQKRWVRDFIHPPCLYVSNPSMMGPVFTEFIKPSRYRRLGFFDHSLRMVRPVFLKHCLGLPRRIMWHPVVPTPAVFSSDEGARSVCQTKQIDLSELERPDFSEPILPALVFRSGFTTLHCAFPPIQDVSVVERGYLVSFWVRTFTFDHFVIPSSRICL